MPDFDTVKLAALERELRRHADGEVRFDDTSRRLYSTDASVYRVPPAGVVLPRSVAGLRAAVEILHELRVPAVPRGGGTSLSGQAVGAGVVIDCSKYLNRVTDIDPAGRTCRVEPGVVLDQLNREVAAFGLCFGPDVSTASRATLAGMIGNNSAGSRSVVYGRTGDHVRRLDLVLSDGTTAAVGPTTPEQWRHKLDLRTLEGSAYRAVEHAVGANVAEVRRRFPNILRRVSGYNLADLVGPGGDGPAALKRDGLLPLVVGSEGTLAVVAGAELGLVPLPAARGLYVPHFSSLAAALEAVGPCLELGPSAVELLDSMLIELASRQAGLKGVMAAVVGKPAALLMVEFQGEPAEVAAQVERLEAKLRGHAGLTAGVRAVESGQREALWGMRRAAVPLMYTLPGGRKPVAFVEDPAVSPEKLPAFAARFRQLLREHGTDGAFYGHASVGCLHIRPVIDLHDPADVARMREIMAAVTDLVLEFGGSLSGEHGDGLSRSEWNRKMFGPAVYEAFRQIKRAFDPFGLMNPGKVVDAPPMTENLRTADPPRAVELPLVFDYTKQEGFFRSVEACNGSGVCRKTQGGAMCPSYRVTRDERDSTRGRANALRLALTGAADPTRRAGGDIVLAERADDPDAPPPPPTKRSPLEQRWLAPVMDLCLSCKACKTECPSNVDMAKLKAEWQHAYHRTRLRPPGHHLQANIHLVNAWAAPVAPLVNFLNGLAPTRWLLEIVAGFDRRRSLPTFHREHLRRWFRRRKVASGQWLVASQKMQKAGDKLGSDSGSARCSLSASISSPGSGSASHSPLATSHSSVLLLDDCFTTYNEPHIGRAAVRVLERAGYAVELAGLKCCGRAMISKGFLREARELARAQLPALAARVADGTPILGLEPSCALTLSDEWPELVPGPEARRVAAAVRLADAWLGDQVRAGACRLPLAQTAGNVVFHGHCHQRALVGVGGSAAALGLVSPDVTTLDAGCCGMAGAFGFEKAHYQISVDIANLALVPALDARPGATVAATGTSCRHQIRDLTGRHALHPIELLDAACAPDTKM